MFRSEEEAQYYLLTIQDCRTALMLAARGGHTNSEGSYSSVCLCVHVCMYICVREYVSTDHFLFLYHHTALHLASERGHHETVQWVVR